MLENIKNDETDVINSLYFKCIYLICKINNLKVFEYREIGSINNVFWTQATTFFIETFVFQKVLFKNKTNATKVESMESI